jgi:hypothetical protein
MQDVVRHQAQEAEDLHGRALGPPRLGVYVSLKIQGFEAVVLNAPVAAHQPQNLRRGQAIGVQVRNEVTIFDAVHDAIRVGGGLADQPDLPKTMPGELGVGEIKSPQLSRNSHAVGGLGWRLCQRVPGAVNGGRSAHRVDQFQSDGVDPFWSGVDT